LAFALFFMVAPTKRFSRSPFAILAGVFYWDNLNPQAAAKTFPLFGVLWAAGMVDL